MPCLYGTLTSQRYHWEGIIRVIAEVEGIADYSSLSQNKRRELIKKYPLFVAWYSAVRLELCLKTVVVPIFGAHAYVVVFEWSPTGGMVHLYYILWRPGAPCFDCAVSKCGETLGAEYHYSSLEYIYIGLWNIGVWNIYVYIRLWWKQS